MAADATLSAGATDAFDCEYLTPDYELWISTPDTYLNFGQDNEYLSYEVNQLNLNASASGTGQPTSGVNLDYGTLSVLNGLNIGATDGSQGSVTVSANGTLLASTSANLLSAYIGSASNTLGQVYIDGGTAQLRFTTIAAGLNSQGSLYTNGAATLSIARIWTSAGENSQSTISLTGDTTLNAYGTNGWILLGMGKNSQSTLLIADNTQVSLTGQIDAGGAAGATGSITLTGQSSLSIGTRLNLASVAGSEFTMSVEDQAQVSIETFANLGNSANSKGTLTLSGGNMTVGQYLGVGQSGEGSLSVEGGALYVTQQANIGNLSTSTGVASISGGSIQIDQYLNIGNAGNGSFYVNGGVVDIGSYTNVGNAGQGTLSITNGTYNAGLTLMVGGGTGGSGTFSMTGGTVNVKGNYFNVGNGKDATGVATITGGILSAPGAQIYVGSGESSTGTLSIGGTASVSGTNISVGNGKLSNGVLSVSGGEVLATGGLYIGNGVSSSGTIYLSGGTLQTNQSLTMSAQSDAQSRLYISGGELIVTNNAIVGRNTAENTQSLIELSGAGKLSIGGYFLLGMGGNGAASLILSDNASAVIGQQLNAGNAAGSGEITLNGNASLSLSNQLNVGSAEASNYTLNVNNNAHLTVSGNINLGNYKSTGIFNMSGGSVVANSVNVGNGTGSTASFNITGGAVSTTLLALGSADGTSVANMDVNTAGIVNADTVVWRKGASFTGELYVGSYAGDSASYLQANTLQIHSGAALPNFAGVSGDATFRIMAVAGFEAATIQSLELADGASVIIDFSGLDITDAQEIVFLAADALTDNGAVYTATGYDESAWQIALNWKDNNGLSELTASITAIPEPACTALVLGALTLCGLLRRRK